MKLRADAEYAIVSVPCRTRKKMQEGNAAFGQKVFRYISLRLYQNFE